MSNICDTAFASYDLKRLVGLQQAESDISVNRVIYRLTSVIHLFINAVCSESSPKRLIAFLRNL